MQLVSFSVRYFRSIRKAHKLPVARRTILIGPNNEGKSNLLDALNTGMSVIATYARMSRFRVPSARRMYRSIYDWDSDFPIDLQVSKPKGQSVIRLEFHLTDAEVASFKSEVGSNLNGTLPIEIRIGPDHNPAFKVLKNGPGGPALSKKADKIARFVGNNLEFTYVPAIRTSSATAEVVSQMVQQKLAVLESNPDYQSAMKRIAELQKPILKEISKQITKTLKQFLPDVHSVKVDVPERMRYRSVRRDCEIVVDDGTATTLDRKGDGIKSLAAISLLYGAETTVAATVMALEEPESHLHPGAIHRLRVVLNEISAKSQIVMTTHNPLFVDRIEVGNNILVFDNCANPAKSLDEIREILGVRASDNLRHARVVLVVEGESDRRVLGAILGQLSHSVAENLESNEMAIEGLAGSGNLCHKLTEIQSALCVSHVYLDNDLAGREACERAQEEKLLDVKDCHLSICKGMRDSEIEDCINPMLYVPKIRADFGVNLHCKEFRNNKLKWSDRVKNCFQSQGKAWNKGLLSRVKESLANEVCSSPDEALLAEKGSSMRALAAALDGKLGAIDT